VLGEATGRLRQGIRDLRTLLVEIHPPNLDAAGLDVALSDLLSPLAAAGVATELELAEDAAGVRGDGAVLLYRVAREAVRNAAEHADPERVRIELTRPAPGRVRLLVSDDGRGFDDGARERGAADGHLGLTLLDGLVAQAGGTLDVTSAPGAGTRVELELPA
jgi:signal transduction histidine kinase